MDECIAMCLEDLSLRIESVMLIDECVAETFV